MTLTDIDTIAQRVKANVIKRHGEPYDWEYALWLEEDR